MKISLEANVNGKVAAPVLDRMLTRIVAVLEKSTGLKFSVKADGNVVRLAHKAILLRKKTARSESIVYDASEDGYTIYVLDVAGQIVDSYTAGNNPQESTSYLAPHEGGLSYESNLAAAEKTAQDLAAELRINSRYVQHDPDILAEERV